MENKLNEFIKKLEEYFPQSQYFVPFLRKNISNKYRGAHTFQQDRITIKQILIVIESFYELVENEWMQIAPTPKDKDIHFSHPEFTNVQSYIKLVNCLKMNKNFISPSGKKANPTQLSLKKILLMNLWAFGLLERKICDGKNYCINDDYFNRNFNIKVKKTFYKLSGISKEILNEKSIIKKEKRISTNIKNRIVLDDIDILYNLLIDNKYNSNDIKKITQLEYALTLNYFTTANNSKEETINAFFELHRNIKSWAPFLESSLKKLQNDTGHFNKNDGFIDWGNWKNQINTKFNFLELTGNFKREKDSLIISLYGIDELHKKRNRSIEEKNKYYEKHKISSNVFNGIKYELHHIVPIAFADDAFDLMNIDSWKNMILISPNKHSQFPKRNNPITSIDKISDGVKINIVDFIGNNGIIILNNNDGYYNPKLVDEMKKYNDHLLSDDGSSKELNSFITADEYL